MLKHLFIKNYALIDTLDINFEYGFSVITGETGAGKSIILGAIGLLLGQRADSKSVKTNAQKCSVEATFDLSKYDLDEWFDRNDLEYDANDCIIRRELTAAGKSRGFINDTPVTLNQMRELGEMLIDVHSQHQNLLLQKEDFQLKVLDIVAANSSLRNDYYTTYKKYKASFSELESIKEDIAQSRANEEFMRFQLNELTSAELKEDEQEELEQERETATHTEDIKNLLYEANTLLNNDETGIASQLNTTYQRISSAADIYPKVKSLSERLQSVSIEVKDIAREVETESATIEFDPDRLNRINERLDRIYTLEHKYKKENVKELLDEQERLQDAISKIDDGDDTLARKQAEVDQLLHSATEKAEKLSESRKKTVKALKNDIKKQLNALGMPNVEFDVRIDKHDLEANGQDNVAFMFSANKGMEMRPVAQVASGGEIARLMLSVKALISRAVKLPTIIFDEIDTGVSGNIAEQMATIMQDMGNADRQVLSITHLPQIAALGRNHYVVEKHDTPEGTTSVMRLLDSKERIMEIAKMLSGTNITDAAIAQAQELLKNSHKK